MAQLTPEQRQQAIRSMVEGLAARLADAPQDRVSTPEQKCIGWPE